MSARMNRSALPFFAASMADRSSSSLVIYRQPEYHLGRAAPSKSWLAFDNEHLYSKQGRLRQRPGEIRPVFAGTRLALWPGHGERPSICLARPLEVPEHDAWRHARAGARHRRHDDDVRVVECGGVAAAAIPGVG